MLKDLIKEGGVYTLANLLTRGMTLILLPFYAHKLTTADFGIYGILGVFGLFVTSILCLQLNQGLGRYVAEPTIEKDKKRLMASSAIWFVTIVYILSAIGILLAPNFFIDLLSSDVEIPVRTFQLAVVSICITGVFYFVGVYMRFLRMYKQVAVIAFSNALFTTLLIIVFVLYQDWGVDGIYLSSIIVTPVIILVQLIVLRKELVTQFQSKVMAPLFRFSIPLVPGAVSYVVLNFTDRLFLKEISMAETGIYEMGSKFSQVMTIIIFSISSALSPIVYQKHLDENTKAELARIFRLFIAAGSIAVLCLSLFSYETLVVFTNEKYYPAATVMPILYLSTFFVGFNMFYIGLNIKEKTKIIGVVVVLSALLNILLNWILIEKYHLMGAAIATLISVCVNNLTLFLISQKYYHLKFPYTKLMIAFSLLFGLMYLGAVELPKWELSLITNITIKAAFVLIFVVFLYTIKLINFMKPIKHIRQQ